MIRKAFPMAVISSFFFAFTFILNRSMHLAGGYWLWGAALRYFFTLPLIWLLLVQKDRVRPVIKEIRAAPGAWFLWSTVGFGLFYAPLCAASIYAESWFTAATWQVTIVAGILLTPLFGHKIPMKNLWFALLILTGVFLMQLSHIRSSGDIGGLKALALIVIGAVAYPLGNRKMMGVVQGRLDAVQRVFGMTLCSMPFWLICAVGAYQHVGWPASGQILQSLLVALFSGVIATLLFFHATDMVKDNPRPLAAVESAQSGEVVFTLLLGILVLGDPIPDLFGWIGLAMIVGGMIANSLS